jgi:hypothetical protein
MALQGPLLVSSLMPRVVEAFKFLCVQKRDRYPSISKLGDPMVSIFSKGLAV